jgi:hypothetical protein
MRLANVMSGSFCYWCSLGERLFPVSANDGKETLLPDGLEIRMAAIRQNADRAVVGDALSGSLAGSD